ncbi:MAG TPA: transaldolase [Firmicutes bacterium]|nr:transaldolase [Bacillota bacterium]
MEILLDSANIAQIRALLPYFPIDGFTTNPSILSKDSDDVKKTLTQLLELSDGKRMIHAQVTAADTAGMVAQAKMLQDFLGENFYVKLPINHQGLRAIPLCREAGINVTVTAVFTPMQALMAAKAGANYVAPYVDRLDNITSDGVKVVGEIVELLATYHMETQVLAASFKNVQQVYNVASMGAQAVTVNPALCEKLIFHPYTDKSMEDFEIDWRQKFGAKEITDFLQ